ncbi:MAG: hypothetical protein Q8S92_10915 [Hydrogenophaga sp.]|uniref:FFLEELY motif protein n=2 Tax=Hydrogenophaga sp. TaxID=1904254 RepID=UPI00273365A7|nr:hypothetical protein [Hydrogenophaga sp.]MDP3349494.1 hypothetical protein [Hydrogenophaga sp.]
MPMNQPASASDLIRMHLARVSELRARAQAQGLQAAVDNIKHLQARRFRGTYADFLEHARYAPATRFFLDELYGVHDFGSRDAQFARIAGALERLFPEAVSQLAVDLSETHALTEVLDHQLALHWLDLDGSLPAAERYIRAWRKTDARASRERQLAVVQHMGLELQRLTRMKTLRLGLRMMRNPARAAGLEALQHFLESGFDAFAALGDARPFLDTIRQRESAWVDALFEKDLASCSVSLDNELHRGT